MIRMRVQINKIARKKNLGWIKRKCQVNKDRKLIPTNNESITSVQQTRGSCPGNYRRGRSQLRHLNLSRLHLLSACMRGSMRQRGIKRKQSKRKKSKRKHTKRNLTKRSVIAIKKMATKSITTTLKTKTGSSGRRDSLP